MKVVTFLLDLLYPPRCAFCHDFLETSGDGLCAHCRTGLPFAQNGGRQRFSFVRACVSPLNVTTGATLSECARVLGKAGAEQVVCATVARSAD